MEAIRLRSPETARARVKWLAVLRWRLAHKRLGGIPLPKPVSQFGSLSLRHTAGGAAAALSQCVHLLEQFEGSNSPIVGLVS